MSPRLYLLPVMALVALVARAEPDEAVLGKERYELRDDALQRLATIVRGADTGASISPRPRPGCMRSRWASQSTSRTTTRC